MFKGWIGEQGCLVNNDSALREDLLTNKNYINQLPQRYNAGYFGKGEFDVNTDSIIKSGNLTSFGSKACNVLSGVSLLDHFYTPQVKKLRENVQNPIHIIPEDNMDTWKQGGVSTRQLMRNMDYYNRCELNNNCGLNRCSRDNFNQYTNQ